MRRIGSRFNLRPTATPRYLIQIAALHRPEKGKGAGLVLPHCDSEAMSLHLAEISHCVDLGFHAVLILDGAGWHSAHEVIVPNNITLLPLPPCAPELNTIENVWQFLRDNWLGNRIFGFYDDIFERCREVRNCLANQPWKIRSARLGLSVIINPDWYKFDHGPPIGGQVSLDGRTAIL